MTPKPLLMSGHAAEKIFKRIGFRFVSQKGSHRKLKRDADKTSGEEERIIIIPNHRELDRWTLKGIIRDSGLTVDEFNKLLRK